MQGAELALLQALNGSSFATRDPSKADFFYVPAQFYCIQCAYALISYLTLAHPHKSSCNLSCQARHSVIPWPSPWGGGLAGF